MIQLVHEITIGVTGHRWNKIPECEAPRISSQLSVVFSAIDTAAHQAIGALGLDHATSIRLVSGMAEGSDQVAVWSRPKGWALDAVLPFPRARYSDDFAPDRASGGIDRRPEFEKAMAQARSVVEFADTGEAVDGYERVGDWLLMQSNLLVAVWDGDKAAGPGGTEALVSRALTQALPVVWIFSRHDREPTILSASGRDHLFDEVPASADLIRGTVQHIVERLPAASPSRIIKARTS